MVTSNNVLVIPGADFSDAAVENIFELCNSRFLGSALLSGSNSNYDRNRIFILTKGNNYQGKPIAKLTYASTGTMLPSGSMDKVRVYKVKPKSGYEGSYVFDKNCAKLLCTLNFEAKTNELVELLLPTSITVKEGEYIGVQMGERSGSNLQYNPLQYSSSPGLFGIPTNSDETTLTAAYDRTSTDSIGIYSIE